MSRPWHALVFFADLMQAEAAGEVTELSPKQIAALEAQHRQSRDRRVCDRIRCVLLSAQGWSTAMIAHSQLIHETTVLRHIADYLDEDKLTSDNGG